jgi:hypothetical protein
LRENIVFKTRRNKPTKTPGRTLRESIDLDHDWRRIKENSGGITSPLGSGGTVVHEQEFSAGFVQINGGVQWIGRRQLRDSGFESA